MRDLKEGSRFQSASGSQQSGAGRQRSGRAQKPKRTAKEDNPVKVNADRDKARNAQGDAGDTARGSALEIERLHPAFGVTLACCCSFRRRSVDTTEIVLG